jgi:hypothetical protein
LRCSPKEEFEMRRSYVVSVLACSLLLAPAVAFAQDAAAQAPATPKVGFTAPSGMLMVQIKPDQNAVFEEMVTKIQAGLAKTPDAKIKEQSTGIKFYRSAEPAAGKNTLYVVFIEPAMASTEYDLFTLLNNVMTDEEKRAAAEAKLWDKYVAAFAAPLGRLNLTPLKPAM